MSYSRKGRMFLGVLIALVGFGLLLEESVRAQTTGPVSSGPRRPRPGVEGAGGPVRPPGTIPGPGSPSPDAPSQLPKIQTRARQPLPGDQPFFSADTNMVTVEISVLDKDGVFIPGIPDYHFQILEDGVPQKVVEVGQSEAPMTVCLLIEFSNLYQQYWSETWYQTLAATYGFINTLRPEDWVAVVAYDLKPEILSDFTQDRRKTNEALQRLRIAGYSESNLFDALTEMATRMKDIEGRKAIVVLSSGVDTFSRLTFKKTREIMQDAGVTVHAIGLMQALREWYDARGLLGGSARMDFIQADNNLRTFSKETGGLSFFPRFYGEFPGIFQGLNYVMRNQYVALYQPSNTKRDGARRKIEVKLIDPKTGDELRITGKKGKRIKYRIIHKESYTAPREVE